MKAELFEDEEVLDWTRRFLARRLGDVRPDDVSLDWPAAGNKSPIALVGVPDGRRAVLRLFERPHHLFKTLRVQQHLVAQGLPVARVLGWSVISRWSVARRYALLETMLPGAPWKDGDEAERSRALPLIAAVLGRMHAVARERSGPVFAPSRVPAAVRYAGHTHERIDKLDGLPGATRARLHEALEALIGDLPSRPHHELIHGRVNNNNFLVHGDDVHVVDLEAACYGDAAQDVVRAEMRLARGDPAKVRLFREAWTEALGGPDQAARGPDGAACDRGERLREALYRADLLIAGAGGKARGARKGRLAADAWARERDEAAAAALAVLTSSR